MLFLNIAPGLWKFWLWYPKSATTTKNLSSIFTGQKKLCPIWSANKKFLLFLNFEFSVYQCCLLVVTALSLLVNCTHIHCVLYNVYRNTVKGLPDADICRLLYKLSGLMSTRPTSWPRAPGPVWARTRCAVPASSLRILPYSSTWSMTPGRGCHWTQPATHR